jgi:hypothetical protein
MSVVLKILYFPSAGYPDAIANSVGKLGHVTATPDTWGLYLPDYIESTLAEKPDIVHLHWPESLCGFPEDHPLRPDLIDALRQAIQTLGKLSAPE